MEVNPIQVEEHALMISPTGKGDPFHQKAFFLKPIDHHQPPSKNLQHGNPFSFDPKEWPLEVEFLGWRYGQEDWNSWVDLLAPLHQSTWRKAGIYNAIISSKFQTRRKTELVFGLAERWCCETNTFLFFWGEASITLEDIMVLGGLSVTGDSVFDLKGEAMPQGYNTLRLSRSAVPGSYELFLFSKEVQRKYGTRGRVDIHIRDG